MSHRYNKIHCRGTVGRQQGVVLIMALLFALAVVILGGSAVRTIVLAEIKAGNIRNQNMSFNAAEATMISAEQHLKDTPSLSHGTTGKGDYGQADLDQLPNNVDRWQSSAWKDFKWTVASNATAVTVKVNGVEKTGYYVIEWLPVTPAPNVTEAYRITVYAQGGNSAADSILQSTYTR